MVTPIPTRREAAKGEKRLRLIRLREVLHRTGLSKTALYDMIKERAFPAQIKLGQRSSAWNEADIDAFIQRKIDGGAA
jgi:prophage regulatory protein